MSCIAQPRDHHRVRVRRVATIDDEIYTSPAPLPAFPRELPPPDLSAWARGSDGIPGVMTRDSGRAGPHVVIVSLVHGNEFSGAAALNRLLSERIVPPVGRLSLVCANLAAFARYDPNNPVRSRFVDEDLNRVWSPDRLASGARSVELDRARALLPIIETADVLLDLHSMLWESDALLLCPSTPSSLDFASGLAASGGPDLVVTDLGHRGGNRLIEHPRFKRGGPAQACLLEAGPHWMPATVEIAYQTTMRALRMAWGQPVPRIGAPRRAIVTDSILAQSARFTFTQPWRGGEIVACGGTCLAQDGPDDIHTPYDACLLIMPNLRPARGHMAVRLARLI